MAKPEKEATFREVLGEITLADLGPQLREVWKGLGCVLVFGAFEFLIMQGSHFVAPTWSIPGVLVRTGIVVVALLVFAGDKSYHEWRAAFYFPKLSFWGLVAVSSYVVGGWQVVLLLDRNLTGGMQRLATVGVTMAFALPAFLLLPLLNLGYDRLMGKRAADKIIP